jgi:mono/diheme cytochrome c family protein
MLAALMIVSLVQTGIVAPWSPRFTTAEQPLPAAITTGLSGPALDGAKLWRSYGCVLCHSIQGYGGIRGPDLTNIANQLTPDQLTVRILNGGYNMPQYAGIMSPTQLDDIVAFLETRRNVSSPGLVSGLQAVGVQGPPSKGKAPVGVIAHPRWSDVHKIFAANCTPCHIQQSLAGLHLDTYQGAMKGGSVAAGGVLTGRVIKPGNARASYLYQAVTGTQKLGARMPLGRAPLRAGDIQTIYNWIQQGARK